MTDAPNSSMQFTPDPGVRFSDGGIQTRSHSLERSDLGPRWGGG